MPNERSAGILKLLAAGIRSGAISGVHQPDARRIWPGQREPRRVASLIAKAPVEPPTGNRRAKLAADVLAALDTQRRIAGALHA